MARLFIHLEGQEPVSKDLNWGITRVGRSEDNDIVLPHASVSSHHAEIVLGLESLAVRDCHSTNGTFVEERPIQEAFLETGQHIRFGQVATVVEWSREQVVVPKIDAPRPKESQLLADDVMSCRNHLTVPSTWHCPTCSHYFCSGCIRGVNLVGRAPHRLCPSCSGHVEPAPWAGKSKRKKSLWTRVKQSFGRTMKMR